MFCLFFSLFFLLLWAVILLDHCDIFRIRFWYVSVGFFFSFFFLFFLFFLELGIISFSLFMLLLLLFFFFFKFSHLKLHDNVFLGCFIFRPYVIKLEQYEVVSKRFLSASPFFSTFEIELEFWKVDQQFDSTPFSIFRMVVKKVANFFMNF